MSLVSSPFFMSNSLLVVFISANTNNYVLNTDLQDNYNVHVYLNLILNPVFTVSLLSILRKVSGMMVIVCVSEKANQRI
jgi:hypothetical protein